MNASEFKKAFKLAQSDKPISADTSNLLGYGLPCFVPVVTTIEAVAKEIRHQGCQLNGGWDMEAVQAVRDHGRRAFVILDS